MRQVHETFYGTVVSIIKSNEEGKSYGFIRPDGAVGGSSANLHFALRLSGEEPKPWNAESDCDIVRSDRVSFVVGLDVHGRKQAYRVKVLDEGDPNLTPTPSANKPIYVDPVEIAIKKVDPKQEKAIAAALAEYEEEDDELLEEYSEDLEEEDFDEYDEYDKDEKSFRKGRLEE